MEFVIRDLEGSEHGPVGEETLKKWVEDDRVTAKTEVRNALLGNWKHAEDFGFLSEVLELQASRELAVEDNFNKAAKAAGKMSRFFRKPQTDKRTSFVCKYSPEAAPIERRMLAWLFDLFIVALVALALFNYSIGIAKKIAIKETGSEELREEDILAEKDPDWVEGEQTDKAGGVQDGKTGKTGTKTTGSTTEDTKKTASPGDASQPAGASGTGEGEDEALVIIEKPRIPDLLPDNLEAITPPSIYADSVNGYNLGSIWQNKSPGGLRYVCIDAGEGAAMWITVSRLRKMVTTVFSLILLFTLFYYGVTLGFFAQTFGMWYWGIFIVKKDVSEVYFLRAIAWTVLMIVLGIFSPLCVYLFRWAPHDVIAKVRVIQVAGTPPAG
ncbi:MAG: hypothetical protein L3J71_02745 [Victivallaceae bacterium]|nr:hypothetical protein [Victivallaceae bacterium]